MDTYIVRIYRYGDKNLKQLFGLVEIPGSDSGKSFASMDELCTIISARWDDSAENKGEGGTVRRT